MVNKISIVLLSTLPDIGIKSLGTKSLIKINAKYFIDYQLECINKTFKNIDHEILIGSYFDYSKTYKTLNNYKKYNLRIIKQTIDNINFGGAMADIINHTLYDNILFINYGCWFDKESLKNLIGDGKHCSIGILKNKHSDNLPTSCLIHNNLIENIFFDISEYKFAELCFLNSTAKQFMLNNINPALNYNKFMFEILNTIIENNIPVHAKFLDNKNFFFITNHKHFNKVRKLINESSTKTKL